MIGKLQQFVMKHFVLKNSLIISIRLGDTYPGV